MTSIRRRTLTLIIGLLLAGPALALITTGWTTNGTASASATVNGPSTKPNTSWKPTLNRVNWKVLSTAWRAVRSVKTLR